MNPLLLNCLIASNHLNKHEHVDPSLLANMLLSISHNKGLKIGMDHQKSSCDWLCLFVFVSNFLCPNVYGHTRGKVSRRKASDVVKGASLRAVAIIDWRLHIQACHEPHGSVEEKWLHLQEQRARKQTDRLSCSSAHHPFHSL